MTMKRVTIAADFISYSKTLTAPRALAIHVPPNDCWTSASEASHRLGTMVGNAFNRSPGRSAGNKSDITAETDDRVPELCACGGVLPTFTTPATIVRCRIRLIPHMHASPALAT
jgi:hypothetical protein